MVVYGSFPTSNHNSNVIEYSCCRVVYGSFPTSNHNKQLQYFDADKLFMGLFLHQTTTRPTMLCANTSCLWVFSYIKPQLCGERQQLEHVVYGSFPTSNHNFPGLVGVAGLLFMGLFLHQTTTYVF